LFSLGGSAVARLLLEYQGPLAGAVSAQATENLCEFGHSSVKLKSNNKKKKENKKKTLQAVITIIEGLDRCKKTNN
jgi:hypothetical protein